MKNKIMAITPYFYPEAGGVANHTYNLYKIIAEKGYEIVVVTSWNGKGIKKEKRNGMRVYMLPFQFKFSNTPISLKWKKQIKEIIEKESPDLINGHMPVPFICDVAFSVSGEIPFILKYHHGGSMKKGKFFMDLLIMAYESIFLKRLFKKSKAIIASSEFVTNEFLKSYLEKTSTIPPGIDTKLFKPSKNKEKYRILFVANLIKSEYYKGLNYLLEAIKIIKKQIPEIKLVVVGEGNLREHYENTARNLGLEKNVEFRGKVDRKNIVKEYQKSWVVIVPSLFDATPNVLLEAMACKIPVIGTKIGGIPYVIDNNFTGLLIQKKNPKAIANAVLKLLKNPRIAEKFGREGYKKVKESFTWEIQAEKTIKLYNEVLSRKNKK